MEQVARAAAGAPRLLLRALLVCFFAALWLLLSDLTAQADGLDTPGQDVAPSVRDTVTSAPDTVDAVPAAEPVAEVVGGVVGDAEETGRRTTGATADAVEPVVDRITDKVDETTEHVRSTVQETTRQVTEVVEDPDPVLAPLPAPTRPASEPVSERPVRDRGDSDARQRSSRATDETRVPLVTQEDPALLVSSPPPLVDLADAAAAVAESASADESQSPAPVPAHSPWTGTGGGEAVPASGGSGQSVPMPVPATQVGAAVLAPARVLPSGAFQRALVAPVERATSPGTTPD